MFFQGLIYIIILVVIAWVGWKIIIKPILESKGIEVDEPEVVKTEHTKRLEKTKQQHKETTASVEAVREERNLKADIVAAEEEIKTTDKEIEEGIFEDIDSEPVVIISSLNSGKENN
jgi:hypothetical protein